MTAPEVHWFEELGIADVPRVGGKNASLGEMVSHLTDLGVSVPDGFATTAAAFHRFLTTDDLAGRIAERIEGLDTDDTRALAEAGKEIRGWIVE